ncbi:hypothetical protein Taro_012486 [Colocasia esculenta]|uniref:Protein TRM32 n=1 Tax=Colocasia esculenta TaxID=4460 RepID=A0A843UDL5_COLES|nr:hypothetical protein [Colocasia esculenta]
MAKHKSSKLSGGGVVPGCWWGILHSFDIQERLHLRRLIGHRRSTNRSGAEGIKLEKAHVRLSPYGDEDYITEAEKNIPVAYRSDSTKEDSGKAQVRRVISQENSKQRCMPKKKGQKKKANPFSSQLSRTISIHHMECDDYVCPEDPINDNKVQETLLPSHNFGSSTSNKHLSLSPKTAKEVNQGKRCEVCGMLTSDGKYFGEKQIDVLGHRLVENQVLLLEKIKEVKNKLLEHQTSGGKGVFARDVALDHPKDFLETLELLNVNRELLLKFLHEQRITANGYTRGQESSSTRRILNKSGSFPGAGFTVRTSSPFDPKCSRDETSFSKKKETRSGTENSQAPSTIDSTETDKSQVVVDTLKPVSNVQGVDETASNSEWPSSFPHVMKSQKDNEAAVYRFKDIKQRVKDIIKENKEERHRISMDGVLHKIPYGRKVSQEKPSPWELSAASRSDGDCSKNSFNSCGSSVAYRRSQSLTESLDRYSYLLEFNFSRGPKRHVSERLKLVPGDAGFQTTKRPKAYGRMLSLPEFDSFFLGKDDQSEASNDLTHSSFISKDIVQGNAVMHNGTDEQKMSDIFDSSLGHTKEKGSCSEKLDTQKIASTYLNCMSHVEWSDEPAKRSPISVPDLHLLEDPVSLAEFSVLPASPRPRQIHFDEPEPLNSSENQSDIDDSSMMKRKTSDISEGQNLGMGPDLDALYFPAEDTHDFHFVRDMLKKYWFSDNEHSARLHSPCHQLSCSIFEEVEGTVYELEPDSRDSGTNLDHGLLFDLTNEVLLEVYETSYDHCPWLSHSCYTQIRPISMGNHFLEKVWANISWHLKSQPQTDPTMDNITSQDFKRNDQWVNLHHDLENVGLDVEALLFDDLLDEAIFECLDLPCQQ